MRNILGLTPGARSFQRKSGVPGVNTLRLYVLFLKPSCIKRDEGG